MKKVIGKLGDLPAEEKKKFQTQALELFKHLKSNFKETDFYQNDKAHECDFAALGIAVWEGETPTFYYLKKGFEKIKC